MIERTFLPSLSAKLAALAKEAVRNLFSHIPASSSSPAVSQELFEHTKGLYEAHRQNKDAGMSQVGR